MKGIKAQKKIEEIQKGLDKNGFISETIIKQLKDVRPLAIEEEDPLVTKIMRLSYEHIEENGAFNIDYMQDDKMDQIANFKYMIDLIHQCDHKYNREELKDYRDLLLGKEIIREEEEEEESGE